MLPDFLWIDFDGATPVAGRPLTCAANGPALVVHHADRLLTIGGRVAFHDMWMPAVRAAAAFVASNRSYERVQEGTDNLLVLRKTAEDQRPWNHYVPPRDWRRVLRRT